MYKKILIASIGFGSGHNKAAEAMAESVTDKFPEAEVKVVDFLNYDKGPWDRLSSALYFSSIKVVPGTYHLFYQMLSSQEWFRPFLFRPYLKKMERFVELFSPDLIISTHVFCAMASLELKKRYANIKAVWGVLTDFMDDAYWNSCRLDRFFVATKELKAKLVRNGIDEATLNVAPIPVKRKFYSKGDRYDICRKIDQDLRPERFTVLVMGGGNGLGRMEEVIKTALELKIQCLVVSGINGRLRKRLERLRDRHPCLFVFGYIDNMDELMDISDLCITKPGGITIAECLAKDLRMVIYGKPLPGPETGNISFLANNRLAEYCESRNSLRGILVRTMMEYGKV